MEVKPMRYCPRCQILVKTGTACPSCGNKKLRGVEANDPVLLYTADEVKCGTIRAALDENGIPHEERMCGPGAPPSLLYGTMPNALYRIFVPFGAADRCKRILEEIGVLGENSSKPDSGETEPETSRRKLIFYRIMASILFLGLIYGVVTLTDSFVDFLKSALH